VNSPNIHGMMQLLWTSCHEPYINSAFSASVHTYCKFLTILKICLHFHFEKCM